MTGPPAHVHVRIRHESDRSYTVLVAGPDGDVEVGTTRSTRGLRTIAREGAALMFGVHADSITALDVTMPQPPYGRDGQIVRIISVGEAPDADDWIDLDKVGQAHWFGQDCAWFVTVAGTGTCIHPSEHLDFDPDVSEGEDAELEEWLSRSSGSST